MRAAVLALALLPTAAPAGEPPRITVFGAASMADALGEIGAAFEADTGTAVRHSFAASSVLARQIEAGAPAEVFVSADREWMDYLGARSRIDGSTRREVAGNALVLIAPRGSRVRLAIVPGFALAAALGRGRLAIGNPDTVPAGRYARAALVTLGAWDSVSQRLLPADHARAALAWVSRGEAPLGVVYRTDARVDAGVVVVGEFPRGSHPAIAYPAAATTGASGAARRYLDYLQGARAQSILARHGFTAPPPAEPAPRAGAAASAPAARGRP